MSLSQSMAGSGLSSQDPAKSKIKIKQNTSIFYFIFISAEGVRITGFNFYCHNRHHKLPYGPTNVYSFQLYYKRSRFFEDWTPYLDEHGQIKV